MEKSRHTCVVKCCGTNSQRMLNVPTKICNKNRINKGDFFTVTSDIQDRIVYEKVFLGVKKEGESSPNDTYKVISPSSTPNQEDQEAIND